MDLEDARCRARFLIRDRDGKFSGLFDASLADAGIDVVRSGVRMPRMNSVMERWVQTCRRELLDRTLIWNQSHLLHALREFEEFYNGHRPHQGIANARPLQPLPAPLVTPNQLASLDIRRRDRLGRLEESIAARRAAVTEHLKEVPRLFLVEDEFAVAMVEAEAAWVRALLEELTSGSFPDLASWRAFHDGGEMPPELVELSERGLT